MEEIAKYADGVGAAKSILFLEWSRGDFISTAHRHDLFFHFWTFRNDSGIIDPPGFMTPTTVQYVTDDAKIDTAKTEIIATIAVWSDGIFSDFPNTARETRDCYANVWDLKPAK